VHPNPDPNEPKRRWVKGALEQIAALRAVAALLREALEPEVAGPTPEELPAAAAAAAASATRWLEALRAPRGLGKAEAELGATAGVCRNAAVAFSSLADADSEQHAARRAACLRLLDQGDHHVDLFFSILDQKGWALDRSNDQHPGP
jgi:hypothetical protein